MRTNKLILFFMFITLFGCSSNNSKGIDNSPLIFLHYWSEDMSGGIDSMISKFNSYNAGYKISATGFEHESYKISMKVMLAGGNPPDLFSYWAGARTASLVKSGYLSPMSHIWKKENISSKFPPAIIEACKYDNKPYIIPVTQHYISFFYNKKIFQKLNLSEPRNWNEFLTLCHKLKSNNTIPIALGSQNKWPAQFWFDYILLRTAGNDYRNKLMSGQANYSDSLVVNAFKIWHDLIKNDFFNSNANRLKWSDAGKMVAEEKAAMTLMGTWITGFFDSKLSLKQETDYNYFSFPIIDTSISIAALGPIDAILLPKKSNITKAEKVLSLFTQDDVQKAMSIGSGSLSPSINVNPDPSSPIQVNIQKELNNISTWAFNYDLANPPAVAELGLTLFEDFLNNPSDYKSLLDKMDSDCKKLPKEVWD